MLFKPDHVEPILAGRKTQTRRLGARRWREGSIHACYTRPPFARGGAEPFCRVRIKDVRRERLSSISMDDAVAEGYGSIEDFYAAFRRINAAQGLELDPEVWVVAFEVVP